jgi:ribosomal protein S18 acetylase RimI-like enzyme
MAQKAPPNLQAVPIDHDCDEYRHEISGWPFQHEYIGNLLTFDIPRRSAAGGEDFQIYSFRDEKQETVGLGTLDICDEYKELANNQLHAYIPLLAVRPDKQGLGYGKSIVQYLIGEATVTVAASNGGLSNLLFLDVYTYNTGAIALYEKSGFVKIDQEHDNRWNMDYVIMATNVSIAA